MGEMNGAERRNAVDLRLGGLHARRAAGRGRDPGSAGRDRRSLVPRLPGSCGRQDGEANLRESLPFVEAYYNDNSSYTEMTAVGLRASYGSGISPTLTL